MYTFHPGRVDKNLVHRHWLWHIGDAGRLQLERKIRFQDTFGIALKKVGAQGCLHDAYKLPDNAILAEIGHLLQRFINPLLYRVLALLAVGFIALKAGRKSGQEQLDDGTGNVQIIGQGFRHIFHTIGKLQLAQIARIGSQQGDFAPVQLGANQQLVETVVFRLAIPDARKGVLKLVLDFFQHNIVRQRVNEAEILDPEQAPVAVANGVGALSDNAQPEVFQYRQHVRQRQAARGVIQPQAQAVFTFTVPIEIQAQR